MPTLLKPISAQLLPSRFFDQLNEARQTYLALPNDDILHGFRLRARQEAPGKGMGGWCEGTSSVIFGQLLSGLARMSSALHDPVSQEKAIALYQDWRRIAGPENASSLKPYGWDKLVGGLVDLALYAGYQEGLSDLEVMVAHAAKSFDRTRTPASAIDWDGRHPSGELEWYTLAENLYRAYQVCGSQACREFAEVWHYPAFWDKFRDSAHPADVHSVHAYSHVNSLCSLAAAYEVRQDPVLLQTLIHAAEHVRGTQCFATGGYGPWERLVPEGGALGEALDQCCDHAEAGCGSWAVFKLATYLLCFTGETKWADWLERVVHNLIGAALPVQPDGRTYYYADYRASGAFKLYFDALWPCCSGTYLQAVSSYQDLLYFAQGPETLCVVLYMPSELNCTLAGGAVKLRQETAYPLEDEIRFTVECDKPGEFALRFRIPAWCAEASLETPDETLHGQAGEWLEVRRNWSGVTELLLRLPQEFQLEPVDAQHPGRCAITRGPLVYAQNGRYYRPLNLRNLAELRARARRGERPGWFFVHDPVPRDSEPGWIRPLYDFPAGYPYRVYHDLGRPFFYG